MVRLTDCLDMTIDVVWDLNHKLNKQKHLKMVVEVAKLILVQGQVNGCIVLVLRKMFLSQGKKNTQRTKLCLYCAQT